MFTVKLVEHSGHEQIFAADHVWAEFAPQEEQPKVGERRMRVYAHVTPQPAHLPDPVVFSSYGTVYVMNDAGQTVARYHLGYGEGDANSEAPRDAALRRGAQARKVA